MEMFSEVEWKKSNATTQELVCSCRSEQFCAVLTETWISDSYKVRFGSTSCQNICDDQVLQKFPMNESFEASGRHKLFDYLWSQNGLRMCQISIFQLTLRKTDSER